MFNFCLWPPGILVVGLVASHAKLFVAALSRLSVLSAVVYAGLPFL